MDKDLKRILIMEDGFLNFIKDDDQKRNKYLEEVAERLCNIDWCIGYELTIEQLEELDKIRDLAYRTLHKK